MTASLIDQQSIAEDNATAIRKAAIAWYARMCSGEANEADRQGLQAWLAQHPDHRSAWARLEQIRQSIQHVPADIAVPTLQRAQGQGRRTILRGMVLLASAGTLAYVSSRSASDAGLFKQWLVTYRTRVGEQRRVMLADGSRMVLNTDSAVDIDFSDTQRTIHLWRGEILIETARHLHATEDRRPFRVMTQQGSVLALGTRFTVRSQQDKTLVAVLDDAVELQVLDSGQRRVLQQGEMSAFSRMAFSAIQPVDDMVAQWEHGMLVVNDWRLGDVVNELARYRRGYLACDPGVAGMRVSGVFPLTDTDKALSVIMKSFPVRITTTTRYWVTVGPV